MGFWSTLFGRKQAPTVIVPEVPAVQLTPQPAPLARKMSIAEVEAEIETLLQDLFPGGVEKVIEPTLSEIEAEKKRKRSEAAKKSAATRAANRAAGYNSNAVDGDGDGMVQDGTIWERPAKPSKPKSKNK